MTKKTEGQVRELLLTVKKLNGRTMRIVDQELGEFDIHEVIEPVEKGKK